MIEQLLQFIQNHWLLISALIVIILFLFFEEFKNRISGIPKISPQAAVLLLNRENAVAVDLRNPKAFDGGHILGAVNLEGNLLKQNPKKLDPYKNKTLILIDESEANALMLATTLKKQGLTKIYLLAGGLPAWKSAGLPLNQN